MGVGVGEVDDEGAFREENHTTPTITIIIATRIIRSFGQVKNFPVIFKSPINYNTISQFGLRYNFSNFIC